MNLSLAIELIFLKTFFMSMLIYLHNNQFIITIIWFFLFFLIVFDMNFTSDCFVFHTTLEKIYDSNFNFFQEVYPYIVSYSVYVSNKGLLNWTYSIAYIQIQKDRIQVFIITKVIYILMHTETNKLVNYIHILPAWISNIGNSGNTSFPQSKRWVLIKKKFGLSSTIH